MSNNRLNVTAATESPPPSRSTKNFSREEKIAKLERMWLRNPEQFNPMRNAIERLRLERTLDLINKHVALNGAQAVDLGCAAGTFSRFLRDKGARVTALDAANRALKELRESDSHDIEPVQDCLPQTRLQDDAYDLVVATDVIAFLQPIEFRLFFAELSRLVKKEGFIVCSTPFDRRTEGGLEQFNALLETEIQVVEWIVSYHRLTLTYIFWLEGPKRYFDASQDAELRAEESSKRKGLSLWWYRIQTTQALGLVWRCLSWVGTPLASALKQSKGAVLTLEKISRFLWDEAGISHAVVIGKRRPLLLPPEPAELPRERKQKRTVWE